MFYADFNLASLLLGHSVFNPVRAIVWLGGSVAEWFACWTQAQKGPGSNPSRDAVWCSVCISCIWFFLYDTQTVPFQQDFIQHGCYNVGRYLRPKYGKSMTRSESWKWGRIFTLTFILNVTVNTNAWQDLNNETLTRNPNPNPNNVNPDLGNPRLNRKERKCADTIGTVPVTWAGHFQC